MFSVERVCVSGVRSVTFYFLKNEPKAAGAGGAGPCAGQ